MKRREFIKSATAAGFVLGATPLLNTGFSKPKGKIEKLGLQMFTLGRAGGNLDEALPKVKAAGYDQIEFAGYGNKTAQEIRALLDQSGLTSPSNHARNLFTDEGLKQAIADAKVIGHKYLIVPSLPFNRPASPPPQGTGQQPANAPRTNTEPTYTLEQAKEFALSFTRIGQACSDAGIAFAFHSHQVEWKPVTGGDVMMEIFMQETDPKLVNFEIDLGWAVAAGVDPLVYFKKYPGRFKLFHLKDITPDKKPCVIGEGTIDFVPLLAASKKAGAEFFIVEQDMAPDPFNNIAASSKFLKELSF
jgi:sugar phosphate isomerase/epimerase